MATVDLPQAFLCKFVDVSLWTVISKKHRSLQSLCSNIPDIFRKKFWLPQTKIGDSILVLESIIRLLGFLLLFCLGFLSRKFKIHRTAGEGGGYLSLPLPSTSQKPRQQAESSTSQTAESSTLYIADSWTRTGMKLLTTKLCTFFSS